MNEINNIEDNERLRTTLETIADYLDPSWRASSKPSIEALSIISLIEERIAAAEMRSTGARLKLAEFARLLQKAENARDAALHRLDIVCGEKFELAQTVLNFNKALAALQQLTSK